MFDHAVTIRLEHMQNQPSQYRLSWNDGHYPLTLQLENSHTWSELLRHLPDVLLGIGDPSGKLTSSEFLRSIGERLWNALLPETAPAEARDGLVRALRTEATPLLLTVPESLAWLPLELLYDPQSPADTGFIARKRPLLRFTPSDIQLVPINPPLRVLLLISSPLALGEQSRFDVESERAAIEHATRDPLAPA